MKIAVNGVKLSVLELEPRIRRARTQDATPIVMIHGLAASSAFWFAAGAPVLTVLGRVLLYDLRGHGKSDVPATGYGVVNMVEDLAGLLDARGIEKAHLVAHSFGGMIALLFALKYPERVATLVLADVRVRPLQTSLSIPARVVPPAIERRLAEIGVDLSAIRQNDDGIDYLRTVAKIEIAAGEEANELLTELYRHPGLFRQSRRAERWIELTERASLVADITGEHSFDASDLGGIRAPMLILAGQNSAVLPSAQALGRLCPHAILREIPNVGHFFPTSHPRLMLRPTLRFLHAANRGVSRLERTEVQAGD